MQTVPLTAPVIEVEKVGKRFSSNSRTVTALDNLTFSVQAGRITGLVGPDGAGKTTLMRVLTGLVKPDSGSIRVVGYDAVAQTHAVQASVGYMPQHFGLYEDLSVAENLELYADLQGLVGAERSDRIARLTDFTGLKPFRKRLAGKLSGGMKQKLGLACTLVRPPRLLLLDEPSVGVDPVSRRELWQIVYQLLDQGISVLWSTAYLDEAERCHDVMLVNEGKLLASGPPAMFRDKLKGRTFSLQTEGGDRRRLLREVMKLPRLVDAIVKGSDIRLLTSEPTDAAELSQRCASLSAKSVHVTQVEPAFEDAFVSILKTGGDTSRVSVASPPRPVVSQHEEFGSRDHGSEIVVEVKGLVRRFGNFTAVDHIDFEIGRGEIFGLLGPNGAGKSTTFKMLCGLLPPSDGTALVLGIDLRKAAALARSHIGYMAQKFSLYGNMTVRQNMGFFASAYGLAGRSRQNKIEAELREFGLAPYSEALSAELPLGFKQRLALACAIMHQPGVLFLDEPTSGVDPLVRREFWGRINAMASEGVTVMVTTHFMEEAEYCDRIGIIYRGRLVASGTPDELRKAHTSADKSQPTLEDAFVELIGEYDREHPL